MLATLFAGPRATLAAIASKLTRQPAVETRDILKYLDISTGYVSRNTMELLESCRPCGMTVAPYEFGAFVSVPPLEQLIEESDAPDDLKMVLTFARKHGCDVVRLDSDGGLVDGLPYFEW